MDKSKKRVEQDYARNAEVDGNTSAGRYEAKKAVELAAGGPTMKGSTSDLYMKGSKSNIHMESNSQEKYNLLTFRDQFINVIRYWLNPQYNLYGNLEKFFLFESDFNNEYIKDYWITYKPLYDNKLIKHINDFVQSQNGTNKKFFVNNNSLQNIENIENIK